MKKIGLVLVLSSILMSGCTATNGILTSKDIESVDKEHLEQLVKKEQGIYIFSEDTQKMIKKINEIKTSDPDSYIKISDLEPKEEFVIEGLLSEKSTDVYFKEYVEILDQTVANGIKKYINSFSEEDILKKGSQYTTIGKAEVFINAPYSDEPYDSENEGDKQCLVAINVMLGDVEDKTYSNLIESIRSKDFSLQRIELGKYQDFIKISNLSYKKIFYEKERVSYELFVDNDKKEIKKAKLIIVKQKGNNINESSLYPLKNISSIMKFKTKDFKVLEDMTTFINKDILNTKKMSTEDFNFIYRGNKDFYRYSDENLGENNLIEITIEKK